MSGVPSFFQPPQKVVRSGDIDIVFNSSGSYNYNSFLSGAENKTVRSVNIINFNGSLNNRSVISVDLKNVSFDDLLANLSINLPEADYTKQFEVTLQTYNLATKVFDPRFIYIYNIGPARSQSKQILRQNVIQTGFGQNKVG